MTEPKRRTAATTPSDAPTELKQERAFQTRSEILAAAAELFSERGYRNTSMQDVAARTGMTKGAVYFHFRYKELLAVAVVQSHYGRWPKLAEDLKGSGLRAIDLAQELLDRAAQAFQTDPVMQAGARLQLERLIIEADLPEPFKDWTNLLTEILQDAEKAGQLRPGVDPAAGARALVSAFFGMQHISATLANRSDLLERWEEVRDLIFGSLRRQAA